MDAALPGAPRFAKLDEVSLNRKKSLSLSLTAWSKRTLVESSELGLDQLPMNWPNPFAAFSSPLGLGTGNAFMTGRRPVPAGFLPAPGPDEGPAPVPRIQRSGTKPAEAACGLAKRSPSYDTKKNVLSLPL